MIRKQSAMFLAAVLLMIGLVPVLSLSSADPDDRPVFFGYVTDYETGDTIEDCGIMIMHHSIGRIVYTNEEGYYEYSVDKGGDYSFVAKKEGYHDEFKDEFIMMGEEKQVDFLMIPYKSQVTGYVTDIETGEPIIEAFIEYRNDNTWSHNRTDEDGYYCIGIEPGTFEVFIDAQDYKVFNEQGYVIQEGDQNSHDFELESFKQGVCGYVRDDQGNPVSEASVSLSDAGSGGWCNTDENGYYEIMLGPGSYRVKVTKSGYSVTKGSTEVCVDQMTEEDWVLYEQASKSIIMRLVKLIMDLLGF